MYFIHILICIILYFNIGSYGMSYSTSRLKRQTKCGKEQFRCSNGECIATFAVCDGTKDCSDGSDETAAICLPLDIECPSFAFRCAYGACIDGDATCDGKQDCADNSDELNSKCKPSTSLRQTNCSIDQFECSPGECINEFLVCDGTLDCKNARDESISQCIDIRCQSFTFQCSYGACIDSFKKCNNVTDCNDGSDEDPILCSRNSPKPSKPTTRPNTQVCPSSSFKCQSGSGCIDQSKKCDNIRDCRDGSDEDSQLCSRIKPTKRPTIAPPSSSPVIPQQGQCVLPDHPTGGRYVVSTCEQGDQSSKCRAIPGSIANTYDVLTFSCNQGLFLESGTQNVFCISGNWQPPIPRCLKYCKALHSNTLDLDCIYQGETVPCHQPMLPLTKVRPKCKPSYMIDRIYASSTFRETECLSTGEWELPLFRCVPECGKANNFKEEVLISFGSPTTVGAYPWHVGLYLNVENVFYQVCGGTLISPHIVLTAAHCVYREDIRAARDPSDLKVAVGKYNRGWDVLDNYEQRSDVKEIVLTRGYRGKSTSYVQDIALLNLVAYFNLSNLVLPACMDWQGSLFPPGTLGIVVGWGLTENKIASEQLLAASLPYLDYNNCIAESPEGFIRFITYDKFCAGRKDGTAVQQGDSGGGLTFVRNGLHFVYGVVSVKPQNLNTFAAFTNVTEHLDWIQTTMKEFRQLHPS